MRFVNVFIFILRTIRGMRWNAERNHVPAVLETYLTNYAWADWHLETKGCLWKSGIEVWNILRYSVALKPLSLMCVMYVTVCPSTSVDPGVFSSIHSCFPQTCPTVLSVFMTRVCVSVCVSLRENLWHPGWWCDRRYDPLRRLLLSDPAVVVSLPRSPFSSEDWGEWSSHHHHHHHHPLSFLLYLFSPGFCPSPASVSHLFLSLFCSFSRIICQKSIQTQMNWYPWIFFYSRKEVNNSEK